ncbi:MAG: flagellar assembly peptidoglycan hydrolase FlgJ, partial [Rhodocyclaceae bacterium]|nr:flagellar assembly peptidoglycan hydrolase FlgJ [Rhodocyclaceae bacterium]
MTSALPVNTLDPNAIADLKRLARDNDPQALEAAAKQFESLFLSMVLKSMRAAIPSSGGLMDND